MKEGNSPSKKNYSEDWSEDEGEESTINDIGNNGYESKSKKVDKGVEEGWAEDIGQKTTKEINNLKATVINRSLRIRV